MFAGRGGKKGSNASQGINCCMEVVAEQLGIMGAEKSDVSFRAFARDAPNNV